MVKLYLWTPDPSAGKWPTRCRSRWGGPGHWGSRKPEWNSLRRCSCPIGPAWDRHKVNAAASESGTRKRWSLGCYHHTLREEDSKKEYSQVSRKDKEGAKKVDEVWLLPSLTDCKLQEVHVIYDMDKKNFDIFTLLTQWRYPRYQSNKCKFIPDLRKLYFKYEII